MSTDVRERVMACIAHWADSNAPEPPWGDDTKLSNLMLDSLDKVELVMDLESEFGVAIPDEVMEWWSTVGDVVAGVEAVARAAA